MARVKRSVHAKKKRRKVLERASGYKGARGRRFKTANEQVMHAMQDAYRDRRARKGDFRRLWITRINAAARQHGTSYSRFIAGLKAADVEVDRKMLAEIAVSDPDAFGVLVKTAAAALPVQAAPAPKDEPEAAAKPKAPKLTKAKKQDADEAAPEPSAATKPEDAKPQVEEPSTLSVADLESMSDKAAAAAVRAHFSSGAAGDADDLKQVKGVGPVTEERLNDAGITTIAQLAGLDATDVDVLSFVVSGFRTDWIESAKELTG